MPELRVLSSAEAVAEAAATEIARGLAAAIAARGVAHWATTGGSSAPGVYRRLGRPPLRETRRLVARPRLVGRRPVRPVRPSAVERPAAQRRSCSRRAATRSGQPGGRRRRRRGRRACGSRPSNSTRSPSTEAIAHSGGPAWAAAATRRTLERAALPVGRRAATRCSTSCLGVGPGRPRPVGVPRLAGLGREPRRRRRPGPDAHRAARRRGSPSTRGLSPRPSGWCC